MNQEHYLFSQSQVLQAIFVPGSAEFDGINFLTKPDNDLQIALMSRDNDSPVQAHQHLTSERKIHSTQEFVWIRSGKAEVVIYDEDQSISHELLLCTGDSILFVSGGHAIKFLTTTHLLEIKQGPYEQSQDKVYLRKNL